MLETLGDRAVRGFPDAKCFSDCGNDKAGVADRRESDKENSIREVVEQIRSDFETKSRLARTAGTRQSN